MLEYLCILLIVVSLNFLLIHLMPGEPLLHILGEEDYYYLLYQHPDHLATLEAAYGLQEPLWVQYVQYVKSIGSFTCCFLSKPGCSSGVLRSSSSNTI